jgi:hypothetical protein
MGSRFFFGEHSAGAGGYLESLLQKEVANVEITVGVGTPCHEVGCLGRRNPRSGRRRRPFRLRSCGPRAAENGVAEEDIADAVGVVSYEIVGVGRKRDKSTAAADKPRAQWYPACGWGPAFVAVHADPFDVLGADPAAGECDRQTTAADPGLYLTMAVTS